MDLIAAASVVVLKTGYGIISECVQAEKPVLYVDSRPGFSEHQFMVRALQENLPCAPVSVDEVMCASSSLFRKADQVLLAAERMCNHETPSLRALPLNGAQRCADLILDQLAVVCE
jgi:UDP-N-acetylglucosamine:LPS N-acetylglucosamine transferase